MELFKEKYRVRSARLPTWNYGNAGAYFITICTHNRLCYFGTIDESAIMQLSALGKTAHEEWHHTANIRSGMNIELREFVVMPNHIHGIIVLKEGVVEHENQSGAQRNNIPSIIRGYKSAVTAHAKKDNVIFAWQQRYHDHVIRSEQEYIRIAEYISNNTAKWQDDEFYCQ